MKQIAYNKYALYEYFVLEKYEAGIVLFLIDTLSYRRPYPWTILWVQVVVIEGGLINK